MISQAEEIQSELGIPLTIKVGELVNQVEILEQKRAHGSGALPGAGVVRGSSIGGGVDRLLVVPVGMSASVLGNHFEGVSLR